MIQDRSRIPGRRVAWSRRSEVMNTLKNLEMQASSPSHVRPISPSAALAELRVPYDAPSLKYVVKKQRALEVSSWKGSI